MTTAGLAQSWTSWWGLALVLVPLLANAKALPGIWHLRVFRALTPFQDLHLQSAYQPAIFRSISIRTHSPMMECDYNWHKSNSTYFADLDVSRAKLIATHFTSVFAHWEGANDTDLSKPRGLALVLAGVSCTFLKELKPYERYDVVSQILSWDQKWVYIVSCFKRGNERDGSIFALAMAKYIFKSGHLTVQPEAVLDKAGFLPPRAPEQAAVVTGVELRLQGPRQKRQEEWDSIDEARLKRLELVHGFGGNVKECIRLFQGTGLS